MSAENNTGASTHKAQEDNAGQKLVLLFEEVKTWSEPDYDAVRKRIQEACGHLGRQELADVARSFLGHGVTGSMPAILQLVSNPILSRLENRFMFS